MNAAVRGRLDEIARGLDLPERLRPYEATRWTGETPRPPVLHLEDISAIPFLVDIAGVELYQHRARVRAGAGDLFAAVTAPEASYEEYCRQKLGFGPVELLDAEPVGHPLEVARAAGSGRALSRLCERAREAGHLSIHPYMAVEPVWELARRVVGETGAEVRVIGPPPPVTWIANDKALFSQVVEATLGGHWLVESHRSDRPAELARLLTEMAGRHSRVGLKRTRCASAMGNAIWSAAKLREQAAHEVEGEVRAFLERTEWPGGEEVLAVAWEQTDLSPSTQLWIPPSGLGPPVLDGVYEQILAGEEKVFVGSRPSGLPAPVNRTLAEAALAVAESLQYLGYSGRCSFDHLVIGDPHGEFAVLFTECNGRWGGTSTPMSLVDRLLGAPRPRPPYRAQDYADPALAGVPFSELRARLEPELFDARTGRGRFVLYNVGPLARYGKLDVISLGDSQEEAERGVAEVLPRLFGLG